MAADPLSGLPKNDCCFYPTDGVSGCLKFARRQAFKVICDSVGFGIEVSCCAFVAEVLSEMSSIYFFASAVSSRAESPEGGGAYPWQPPAGFQCTPGSAAFGGKDGYPLSRRFVDLP
jgi:hypothetical protein